MFEMLYDLNVDHHEQSKVILDKSNLYLSKMIDDGENECYVRVPRQIGLSTKIMNLNQKYQQFKFSETHNREVGVTRISWVKNNDD